MKNWIYINGGPGLSAQFERNLISDKAKKGGILFDIWDQPKGASTYQEYKRKLLDYLTYKKGESRAPLNIACHSYGAFGIGDILRDGSFDIGELVLIAPGFNLPQCDLNILEMAKKDFLMMKDSISAEVIDDFLAGNKEVRLNSELIEVYKLVVTDPHLFNHYFCNDELTKEFIEILSTPEHSFDLDDFFNMRSGEPVIERFEFKANSVKLLLGEIDPIVERKDLDGIINLPNLEEIVFKESSHYPHLEKVEDFIQLL